MKKWVYTVCGYVYEGKNAPEKRPQCGVPAPKFKEQVSEGMTWACEREVGVAQGPPEDIMMNLKTNSEDECPETDMYLAMSKAAHREGYSEIGMYWAEAAFEKAEHAAKLAEPSGEVVTSSIKENLEMRIAAENGAVAGKFGLVRRVKALSLDAIHNTVHEMAKGEARHGKTFEGLLNRYSG